MIVIIDYGVGNLGSVYNMFKKIGAIPKISSNILDIEGADKLILSGVGSFDYGMKQLYNLGLIKILNEKVIDNKIPILGICLGMQLFTKCSEEGTVKGLGWFDAETIKFQFDKNNHALKVPHMGWNTIKPEKDSLLFSEMYDDPRFYFLHSYHVTCKNNQDILGTTKYGYEFPAALEKGNILGVQFHPEKSHKFGMQILKNFILHY